MYKPLFQIRSDLLNLLTRATELRAWIGRATVDVTWLSALQRDAAARLAHSSTSIEGNPLTLPEVRALAHGKNISTSPRAKQEVLDYLAALRWIGRRTAQTPLREIDVLGLHHRLTAGTLPADQCGRYKTRPNRVIDARGHLLYTPPPPAQARPLTRQLLDWTRSVESRKLHAVLVSSIVHHRMVSIHPFADGNGRLARAMAVWVLYHRGFDTQHLFALDEYFERDRPRYYAKLQQARDLDYDLTYWLEYVAQGVVETLEQTQRRIESLQVAARAPKIILTARQEEILRLLRDRDRIKSSDVVKVLGLTRARAHQILQSLMNAGLVKQEGQTRATSYRLVQP